MSNKQPSPIAKDNVWPVRGVDDDTKRLVRVFAAQNDITLGSALTQLVQAGYVRLVPTPKQPK